MKPTYTIHTLKELTHPDLYRFFEREIAPSYTEEVFKWEYAHEKSNLIYYVKNNNEVVGTYGFIAIELEYKNKIVNSVKGETNYIKSSEQGLGLYEDLLDKGVNYCNDKNIDLLWGFVKIKKNFLTRLGIFVNDKALYEAIIIMKPKLSKNNSFKSKSLLHNKYVKFLYHLLKSIVFKTKYFLYNKKLNKKRFFVSNSLIKSNDILDLFKHIRIANPNILNLRMSIDFLNHRVFNNPFNKYLSFFIYNNENELQGYIIISLNFNKKTAYIADLTALNISIKEKLLSIAIKNIKKQKNICFLNLFGNISNKLINENFSLLKKNGASLYFTEMNLGSAVLYNQHQYKDLYADNYSNWYINGLWTEGLTQ